MIDSRPSRGPNRADRTAERVQLEERVFSVKKRFLAMYKMAHAGHIGSSLSCAEILVFLKYAWMRDEDTFVLSKGHAVAALYALLAEVNALDPRELDSFYGEGTRFPALPPVNTFEEIPFATGSLGHGLSLCAGMALGAILNRRDRRFFCLTSDGELDAGSTWEAALFIAHHKLTNVVWLIDRNRIQGIGGTEEVLALEPLDAKLDAFGFQVVAADGHDFTSLLTARDVCSRVLAKVGNRPVAIICQHHQGSRHSVTCKTRWRPTTCRWTTRNTSKLSTSCRWRMRLQWQGPAMRDEFARTMIALFGRAQRSGVHHRRRRLHGGRGDRRGLWRTFHQRRHRGTEHGLPGGGSGPAKGICRGCTASPPSSRFRPYEQIRTDVCLHKLPVKLVGNGGGYGYGIMGATHHALEDVGAMRVLPNMRLYVPLTGRRRGPGRHADGAGSAAQLLATQYRRAHSGRDSCVCALAEDSRRTDSCVVIGMGPVLAQPVRDGRPGFARRAGDLERGDASPSRRFPPTSSQASTKSNVW